MGVSLAIHNVILPATILVRVMTDNAKSVMVVSPATLYVSLFVILYVKGM
jgi:hypothetical protein